MMITRCDQVECKVAPGRRGTKKSLLSRNHAAFHRRRGAECQTPSADTDLAVGEVGPDVEKNVGRLPLLEALNVAAPLDLRVVEEVPDIAGTQRVPCRPSDRVVVSRVHRGPLVHHHRILEATTGANGCQQI